MNDEYSGEAKCQHNVKDHYKAEVNDDKEDKVDIVIPPVRDKTEQTNRTLTETEECQLQHKQFVQTREDILLDCGNG